jgi:hypothetical protein
MQGTDLLPQSIMEQSTPSSKALRLHARPTQVLPIALDSRGNP